MFNPGHSYECQHTPIVFRELLQNSDDASATAVEIHFETKDFVDKRNSKVDGSEEGLATSTDTALPDLKTALVRFLINMKST